MAGLFDDLIGGAEQSGAGLFDDLKPESDGAFKRGWNKATNAMAVSANMAIGDNQAAAERLKVASDYNAANPGSQESQELMQAWEAGDGISGGFSSVGGEIAKDWREASGLGGKLKSAWDNTAAFGEMLAEQTGNMVAPMAGMGVGHVAGRAVGTPIGAGIGAVVGAPAGGVGAIPGAGAGGAIGGTVGGIGGSILGGAIGNAAQESGYMALGDIQEAGIDPGDVGAVRAYLDENSGRLLQQGATKGAIIATVDRLTMGIASKLLNGPLRDATNRALANMGVDAADKAAVKAATQSSDFAAHLAGDAAYQSSKQGAERIARNMAAFAVDPAGEFTGEFVGTGVATGEWDAKDATLEAVMGLGQSGVMYAGQKAYQAATGIGRGAEPMVQPQPTAENPAPAPVPAPDPAAGPISRTAAQLPGPSIAGLLPDPGQTLYGDAAGNLSPDGPSRNVDREYRPTGRERGPQTFGPGMDQSVPMGEPAPLEGQLIRGGIGARPQPAQRTPDTFDHEPSLGLPAPGRAIPDMRGDNITVAPDGTAVPGKTPNSPPANYVQGGPGMDQQREVGKTYRGLPAANRAIRESANPEQLEAVKVGPQTFEVRPKAAEPDAVRPVLQNRDRSTPASITQMRSIAARPDYQRVSISRDFANGAPVVEPGAAVPSSRKGRAEVVSTASGRKIRTQYAVIEASDLLPSHDINGSQNTEYATGAKGKSRAIAGNGRVTGISHAYAKGTASEYRRELEADAAGHGISPEAIKGMKQPVLVRIMPQDQITQDIGDESNTATVSALSAAEQARNDAARIDAGSMAFDDNGEISEATVRQFIQSMPEAERGGLLDGGRPSRQAYDRAASAVFASAYESDELIRLQAQATDPEARTVLSGLLAAASKMARLKGQGQWDIRGLVVEAAQAAVNATRNGQTLASYAEQLDIERNPEATYFIDLFAANSRSGKRIGEQLSAIADTFYAEASKPEFDMFGAVPRRSRQELLGEIDGTAEGQPSSAQPTGQQAGTGTTEASRPAAAVDEGEPAGTGADAQAEAFQLNQQTEEELAAADAATKARIKAEEKAQAEADEKRRKEEERAQIKAQSEAQADNFTLGVSGEDALSGQAGMFDSQPSLSELGSRPAATPKQEAAGEQKPLTLRDAEQLLADAEKADGEDGLLRELTKRRKLPADREMIQEAFASIASFYEDAKGVLGVMAQNAVRKRDGTALKEEILDRWNGDLAGLQLSNAAGTQFAFFLPDATEPGRFRASLFDARGFFGHSTRDSYEQLLDEQFSDGFRVEVTGKLEELAGTDSFAKGNELVSKVQAVNAGQMTWAEFVDQQKAAASVESAPEANSKPASERQPIRFTADQPASDYLADGSIIEDGQGQQYRVHYQRNDLVVAHPIVDGKAKVNAESSVRFHVGRPESADGRRTDPIYLVQDKRQQERGVADQLASMSPDDLSALIDEISEQEAAPQTSKPKAKRSTKAKTTEGKPRIRPAKSPAERTDTAKPADVTRTAGAIAKSMGVNMSKAGMNALEGLTQLFGGPGRLNSGLSFDEETYAKAKPYFAAAMADVQAAGKDLRDFIRALLSSFGDGVKPYILRYAQDLKQEQQNVGANSGVESDSTQDAEPGAGANVLGQEPGEARPADRQLGEQGGGAGAGNADGISAGGSTADGKRGDQQVDGQQPAVEAGAAGSPDGGRGSSASTGGLYAERNTDQAADRAVEQAVVPQKANVKASNSPATLAEIKQQMPFLTEGQAEDVVFAEKRLMKPDGYGVLYTNGTGTGKTFSGLGIAARANANGKSNILIVVPKQTIADAWVKAGEKFFDLPIKVLDGTKDNGGSGIVVTTYANLGANPSLALREWDMVIADEAHYLSSAEDGATTNALENLRALTKRRGYARNLVRLRESEKVARLNSLTNSIDQREKEIRDSGGNAAVDHQELARDTRERDDLTAELEALYKAEEAAFKAMKPEDAPRGVLLSATPFAYEKNVHLAQQFLFDWGSNDDSSQAYNSGGPFERFMMQHFGYRMRYNKLTEPDAKVDRGLMQRAFNSWLKREGALSARALESAFDYDRKFVTLEAPIGRRVDDALKWLRNRASNRDEQGNDLGMSVAVQTAYRDLQEKIVGENFNYHARMYFLEAIKAREALPHIRAHLAKGRKVVVMHDFKQGGVGNPFIVGRTPDNQAFNDAVAAFSAEFSDLQLAFSYLPSPIAQLTKAFPGALVYNGDYSAKKRVAMQNAFNDDSEGAPNLIIAQGDAMREGVSIHDTTGKHQRVLVHLGMPVKPTAAIQQEGRIYRTGQASHALFRYFTIGTAWERSAFASKIAMRAGAAENLAMGEQARGLKQAFIDAYETADLYEPGFDGEGTGGKDADFAAAQLLTPWDTAKSFYFGTKTQGKGRSSAGREGNDYFATPEPLGLKMVEWADIRGGESVLEPSAGHGAIARWFPDAARVRVIEHSADLASRVSLHVQGDVIHGRFEDHHVVNKYDGIVMNPPFGLGGAVAIPHLAKAADHLREGGRVVALIPTGPAADKKFDNWFYGLDKNGKPLHPDLHLIADVKLPGVTFERAGTSVATRIVIIEKVSGEQAAQLLPASQLDLSSVDKISELFDRLESIEMPARLKPVEAEVEQTAPSKSVTPKEPKQSYAEKAAAEVDKYVTDAPIIEHTTAKGKVLRGVIVRDMSLAEVKSKFYEFAFKKDGGVFLRAEFVQRPGVESPRGGYTIGRAAQQFVNEPTATESGYETDLFGNPVPAPRGRAKAARSAGAGVRGDVQPASTLSDTPTPAGRYHVKTIVGTEVSRRLGTDRINSFADLAQATQYLYRSAVERFDGIVTDKDGKPLAVVGGFKGAIDSASVPIAPVIAEAVRVRGAANIWLSHNHPSGLSELSSADRNLHRAFEDAFAGSGIEVRGLIAVGRGEYGATDNTNGRVPAEGNTVRVPVIEREQVGEPLAVTIESPAAARAVAAEYYEEAGRPGMILLDTRHRVTGWAPFTPGMTTGALRNTGGLNALYRAVSEGNVAAAILVHGGELDTLLVGTHDSGMNIAAGLDKVNVRVLDVINATTKKSRAEAGSPLVGHALYRLGEPGARGIPLFSAKAIAKKVMAATGLNATVVNTEADLPADLQAQIKRDKATGRVAGVYHNGTAYLVASNLRDAKHAVSVMLHEAVGHVGVKSVLGDKLGKVMAGIYRDMPAAIRKELERRYASQIENLSEADANVLIAEEYVAHLAETDPQHSVINRLVALLRRFIRDTFGKSMNMKWTRNDIVLLLAEARVAARNNGGPRGGNGARFNLYESFDQSSSYTFNAKNYRPAVVAWAKERFGERMAANGKPAWQNFVRYFGDSKVVDAEGKPLVVKHGSRSQFNEFREVRGGMYFTEDGAAATAIFTEDGRGDVGEYYLSLQRPFDARWKNMSDAQKADLREIIESVVDESDIEAASAKLEVSIEDADPFEVFTDGEFFWGYGRDLQNAVMEALKSRGYDGVIFPDALTFGEPHVSYVAFRHEQIKSATDNNGDFDPGNPDIRYSLNDEAATTEALRKLGLGGRDADGIIEQIRNMTLGGLKAKLGEWSTRSEEGIFDGLAGIKRAEEAVGVTDANSQGYVSARMATGIADVMHGVLHYAAPEWRDGVISGKADTRGVLEILGDLGQDNLTPWLAWLGGKRAQMLKAQGRENNLTDADITELLAMGRGKEELFEKVYRDYAKTNEAVLDLAEGAGLIDKDARAKWATEYYVPFYRQDEAEGIFTAPRTKRGLSHQTAAIKALKGGTLPTNDLLTNMLTGWTKRIDAAMKNKALLEVVDNLKGSEFLSDESPRFQQVLISRSQIAQQIRKDRKALAMAADMLGLPEGSKFLKVANQLMKPENEGFEKLWTKVAPTDPDIIRVQRGGKNEYYRVNDESLLRGLKFMEGSVFNDPITRIGRTFKRLLTTGVTASPDFILRNFIRDAAHAWMINKDGFVLGKDSIKGMRDALREDQDYRDLMFAGGSFQGGYVHGADPEASAQIIRRALEKKGFTKSQQDSYLGSLVNTPAKAAAMLGKGWQSYRGLGDKVENANRLSTYKAALAAGKSKRQAAFEAKDLMDYSLRGNFAAAQWFTDVVPFLNARLQGLYKLGRAMKDDKTVIAKEVALKGAYIALFSLLLAGINDDDERYQELQDWDKDMHWHIFLGDQHFRIPKPFELGLIFGTIPERLLHALTGTQDGGDLAKAVSNGVFQTLAFNPVPQFYQPIRELQANRNFFRDMPIEDMSDEGKLPEARFDERTSAIGRALGQVTGPTLGISPKQLDHLVQGYTGTLGGYVLGMSNLVAGAFDDAARPSARAGDLPVVKVLYQGDDVRSTKYQSEFYDMMREADQLHRTIKAYREEGRVDAAAQLLESSRDKLRHRAALGMARQQLGAVRKQMDAVYRDTSMSGEAKRAKLDHLQVRANQIAERIVRRAGGDF